MKNPYSGKPGYAFWQQAVVETGPAKVDPIVRAPFTIGQDDAIATAGSCFAQHIARTLAASGFDYLVTEREPLSKGAKNEGYGLFSARFGNLYTVRQLLQLFDRAYGLFEPRDVAWGARHGPGLVDPFRPAIQAGGFASLEALKKDREAHFSAVRQMFEECSVFIFTLGLTEAWVSKHDGAVFPLAPGVGGAPEGGADDYTPVNFKVGSMIKDMILFLNKLQTVNPTIRVILTVSPVPLIATFEDRHVMVSTTASKSALRVVADEISEAMDFVAYFPSYEIVTAHFTNNAFEADQRSVRSETVAKVMELFAHHYLTGVSQVWRPESQDQVTVTEADIERFRQIDGIVCDEEEIVRSRA